MEGFHWSTDSNSLPGFSAAPHPGGGRDPGPHPSGVCSYSPAACPQPSWDVLGPVVACDAVPLAFVALSQAWTEAEAPGSGPRLVLHASAALWRCQFLPSFTLCSTPLFLCHPEPSTLAAVRQPVFAQQVPEGGLALAQRHGPIYQQELASQQHVSFFASTRNSWKVN